MKKTTFQEKFEKSVKFYDFTYHLHKSTFKGLTSFYKLYSEVEKQYADSLIKLSKQVGTQIPELNKENGTLIATIKQVINSIQAASQLHFNYSQRLMQISAFYNSEYLNSKKRKDAQMRMLKDKNQDEYTAIKERERSRNAIIQKQKEICKSLYVNLDKLSEEQNERVHKVKEQTIIYFSIYKKVCERQLETTSDFNLKLIKQDFQVSNSKIAEIAEQLRIHFNQYGGEQIQRRSYDVKQPMIFNRSSLRASMALKQRMSKISDTKNKLKQVNEKYRMLPDTLFLMNESDPHFGFFENRIFQKQTRRKYSRELNSQTIRNICFEMLDSFSRARDSNSDELLILQIIKANLKYKPSQKKQQKCQNLQQFISNVQQEMEDSQYIYHIKFLEELSGINPQSQNCFSGLDSTIEKYKKREIRKQDIGGKEMRETVKLTILDILIDTLCHRKQERQILVDSYLDYLNIINLFSEGFLSISKDFVLLILLKKLDRMLKNRDIESELELIIQDKQLYASTSSDIPKQTQFLANLKQIWATNILNSSSSQLLRFFTKRTNEFLNSFKILLIIEKFKFLQKSKFNALEQFYSAIKYAGFNYVLSEQLCHKMLNADLPTQERLKYIVQGVESLDYEGVIENYIDPASTVISKLLGVGQKKVKTKLFDQFTASLMQIMNANLELLSSQEGTDRDGYVLRLGIILAKMDLKNPQPISEYETFFQVLKTYLQATEKDYDNLLQHSRKTQLWIMQQNELATSNCIDFCSLLYKPFQFLLISLKEIEKQKKSQYALKYSEFIKVRLNTVLKDQILKYISFLFDSLNNYKHKKSQLTLKPKKMEKLHNIQKEEMEKDKQTFKQITRRLFNLGFLKQQLEQMVNDFLEPQIYKQLGNSIFNLDKLNRLLSQNLQYKQILGNIKEIVEAVLANQQKIVRKVAEIAVFTCLGKLIDNIYFQQQKNAIQQFFSNSNDYKLSEITFLKYQEIIDQWLTVISKNIPSDLRPLFQIWFLKSLFQSIRFQVLNSNKFKIPIKQSEIISYLDSDVSLLATTMKQKFFENSAIEKQLKGPFKNLLGDLQTETQKIMSMFEGSTLKNNKEQGKYFLVILNLRIKDEKAIEFVKKYKTIVNNN